MKYIKHILLLAVVAMFATSCDELDGTSVADKNNRVTPVLNDNSAIVITDANKNVEEATFTWSPADFGYQAAVTYTLYGVYGSGEPFVIGTNTAPTLSILKNELNNLLCLPTAKGGQGAPENDNVTMNYYVVASIADQYEKLTSATKSVSISTTTAIAEVKHLWTPGDYQGWAPATAPNIWETSTPGVYEGFVGILDAAKSKDFKFTTQPDWSGTAYGAGSMDASTSGNMTFNTDGGAGNLTAPANGIYHFYNIDVNALTGKYEMFTTLEINGAFNGWDTNSAVSMDYDVNTNTWSASVTFADASSEFLIAFDVQKQVAAGANWADFKFGQDGGNIVFKSGNNLISPATAGTYTVKLNFNASPYELTFE